MPDVFRAAIEGESQMSRERNLQSCGTCRFWGLDGEGDLPGGFTHPNIALQFCRKNAPTANVGAARTFVFPMTASRSWCGEYLLAGG